MGVKTGSRVSRKLVFHRERIRVLDARALSALVGGSDLPTAVDCIDTADCIIGDYPAILTVTCPTTHCTP
jgi:hypothetical protein